MDDYDSLTPCDHSQHPSGRVGKPEDVCNACLFLARVGCPRQGGLKTNLALIAGRKKQEEA